MCIICLEYQKNKLTLQEARRNFCEMALSIDVEHRQEVEDMLDLAEEKERMEAEYYDPFHDFYYDTGSD
jgi:hypothetical protein